jgi:hypothetical protein
VVRVVVVPLAVVAVLVVTGLLLARLVVVHQQNLH